MSSNDDNFDECEIYGKTDINLPINEESLSRVVQELGIIQLEWPTISEPEYGNRTSFPETYYKNNNKEKLVLAYAENFRRQFVNMFPKRRPLLLQALNECGMEKMVCTTIRPTRIPIPEFLTWQGCATFVADFCLYKPLAKKILLPERIVSPVSVLKSQAGTCFELATLLVSLLKTAHCEAYAVVGRATEDRTLAILKRTDYAFEDQPSDNAKVALEEGHNAYRVDPPVDFLSKHLQSREQQRLQRIKDEKKRRDEEFDRMTKELEKPPFDQLYGWRIHAWVLIVSVKSVDANAEQELFAPFFIEPSTGERHELLDPGYLMIESVYNHENYYVPFAAYLKTDRMPTSFDFGDETCWEKLLCDRPKSTGKSTEHEQSVMLEKYLDMPSSWVEKLEITISDVEHRYPSDRKTVHYKKCIVEKYAPYSRNDGLLQKVTKYEDYEYKTPLSWYEIYENRSDSLVKISYDHQTNYVSEYFDRGRRDFMKKHSYQLTTEPFDPMDINRNFYFYPKFDDFVELSISPLLFKEYYQDRNDGLLAREIKLMKGSESEKIKTAMSVKEIFGRNLNIAADENISEKTYFLNENKVTISYHFKDNSMVQKKGSFMVTVTSENGELIVFRPDMIIDKEAMPLKLKNASEVELYQIICQYSGEMKNMKYHVSEMENKIHSFIDTRSFELTNPSIVIPLFYTEKNDKIKELLKQKGKEENSMKERELKEFGLWPGTPYMEREGTKSMTDDIKNTCLNDFKNTQVARQNVIQKRYDKCIEKLRKEELWYLSNKYSLQPETESMVLDKMKHIEFEIETLEVQLKRHQELTATRHQNLINELRLNNVDGICKEYSE